MTQNDVRSYKGWLNSDSFVKRALAVFGHNFIGGMMITVPLCITFYILLFIFVMRFWS